MVCRTWEQKNFGRLIYISTKADRTIDATQIVFCDIPLKIDYGMIHNVRFVQRGSNFRRERTIILQYIKKGLYFSCMVIRFEKEPLLILLNLQHQHSHLYKKSGNVGGEKD